MAADKKSELLALIDEKMAKFSQIVDDPNERDELLYKLEKLKISINGIDREKITPMYYSNLLFLNPELTSSTLGQIASSKNSSKSTRKQTNSVDICDICGEMLNEGICSNCGKQAKERIAKTRGKSKDQMSADIESFRRILDTLLAKLPLPPEVEAKKEKVIEVLKSKGYRVAHGAPIDIAAMRYAFKMARLGTKHIWCSRMRYELTGFRPRDYSEEDTKLFHEYYVRCLEPFSRLISSSKVAGSKEMTNKWSEQAIFKVIIQSSTTLRAGHSDFFDTLNLQNQETETTHARIWSVMTKEYGWTFR